jgi:hypothetical protein
MAGVNVVHLGEGAAVRAVEGNGHGKLESWML